MISEDIKTSEDNVQQQEDYAAVKNQKAGAEYVE